ncbi:MAG: ribbon-helix-helix domain-containing protein [Bacteroidales bacterium]|nr:ribbon-helix-helix domain-containing protein [Bacteroidales bacterium]
MGGIGSGGSRENAGRPATVDNYVTRLSVYMPEKMALAIRKEAEANGMSVSELIRQYINAGMS